MAQIRNNRMRYYRCSSVDTNNYYHGTVFRPVDSALNSKLKSAATLSCWMGIVVVFIVLCLIWGVMVGIMVVVNLL